MTVLEIEYVRPLLEAEIDRLIGLLDMLEPDPDFEDGDDLENDIADQEPLYGAPEQVTGSWRGIDASNGCDDGEELELGWTELEARYGRYAGAGDDVYEPSLGSNGGINQTHWSKGPTDDREVEFDGREPDSDFEPWLGVSEPTWHGSYCDLSQLGWSLHQFSDDRELDDEREPDLGRSSCYAGPCSPVTTMAGPQSPIAWVEEIGVSGHSS